MPNTKKPDATASKVSVLLFDGFSNLCLANTVEPLRAANTIAGQSLYAWQFLSVDGRAVCSSSGLPVTPDAALDDSAGDLLVVMPSYGYLRHSGFDTVRALRRARGRFQTLAGLDTGSWLLADAGLLDGYQATIHWEELEEFAHRFAQVDVSRARFVIDRDRITCTGAAAAFDLALELITRAHGAALALDVAQIFMTRLPDTSSLYDGVPTDRLVRRAIGLMRDALEQPRPVAAIARDLGCSLRKLELHVRGELGITPRHLYRRLRLAKARKLVAETDLPIAEVAVRSGYENASALSRAFRAEFGQAPRELRRAAGG